MLVIRPPQMTALSIRRSEQFIDRMVAVIKRDFPRQYDEMEEKGVRNFVNRCIRTAKASGVFTEPAIAVLIELFLQFGEDFRMSPERTAARNLLANQKLPEQIKVGAIQDRLDRAARGRMVVPFKRSTT